MKSGSKVFEQLRKKAAEAARLLKAMSHPDRLGILCHLVDGERSVGDLQQFSDLSQSAFSQHLSVLRKQGLVKTRKVAQQVFYTLANPRALAVLEVLQKMYCPPSTSKTPRQRE